MNGVSQYDIDNMDGEGDWFTARLLRLLPKADTWNLERFRKGFPDEVALYVRWRDSKRDERINVRAAAITVPQFVQWVIQRHGPQPEEWTSEQYWALVREYDAERS
jgi:hypothetical protein